MGFMYMLVEYRYKLENNDIFYYMYNGSHFLFHMFLIVNRMNNYRYTDPLKDIPLDAKVRIVQILCLQKRSPRTCAQIKKGFICT